MSTVNDGMTFVQHQIARDHGDVARYPVVSNDLERPRLVNVLIDVDNGTGNEWVPVSSWKQTKGLPYSTRMGGVVSEEHRRLVASKPQHEERAPRKLARTHEPIDVGCQHGSFRVNANAVQRALSLAVAWEGEKTHIQNAVRRTERMERRLNILRGGSTPLENTYRSYRSSAQWCRGRHSTRVA